MKNANRTLLLSLLGVAVATPFLVVALVVGARAIALADGLHSDLLVVVLALASVVASMGEGRIGIREGAPAKRNRVAAENETDLRGVSTLNHGY
jgi:hypothetical protein